MLWVSHNAYALRFSQCSWTVLPSLIEELQGEIENEAVPRRGLSIALMLLCVIVSLKTGWKMESPGLVSQSSEQRP